MAKPWREVAESPEFQSLPQQARIQAKQQYFDSVVAPRVPEAKRETARQQFFTSADPIPLRSAGDAATPEVTAGGITEYVKQSAFGKPTEDAPVGEEVGLAGPDAGDVFAGLGPGRWKSFGGGLIQQAAEATPATMSEAATRLAMRFSPSLRGISQFAVGHKLTPETAGAAARQTMERAGYDRGIFPQDVADNLSATGAEVYRQGQQQIQRGRPQGTAGQVAYDLAGVLSDLALAGGVGVLTGGAGFAPTMAATMAGQSYGEGRAPEAEGGKGLSPGAATERQSIMTAAEFVLNQPVGALLHQPAKKLLQAGVLPDVLRKIAAGPGGRIAGTAVAEGIEESGTSLIQDAFDRGALGEDITLAQMLKNAGYSALLGGVAGGMAGGLSEVVQRRSPQAATSVPGPAVPPIAPTQTPAPPPPPTAAPPQAAQPQPAAPPPPGASDATAMGFEEESDATAQVVEGTGAGGGIVPAGGQAAVPGVPGDASGGAADTAGSLGPGGAEAAAVGEPAGSAAQQPASALTGFEVGQVWTKPGRKGGYRITQVSEDGKRAKADFGQGSEAWIHFDTELDNGWMPEGEAAAVQSGGEQAPAGPAADQAAAELTADDQALLDRVAADGFTPKGVSQLQRQYKVGYQQAARVFKALQGRQAQSSSEVTATAAPDTATAVTSEPQTKKPAKPKPEPTTSEELGARGRKALLGAIKNMGGIDLREGPDITGERGRRVSQRAPGLFRRNGRSLDQIAEMLVEQGFMAREDLDDVTGSVQKVRDLIASAINKEAVVSMDDAAEFGRLKADERAAIEEGSAEAGLDTAAPADMLDAALMAKALEIAGDEAYTQAILETDGDEWALLAWATEVVDGEQARKAGQGRPTDTRETEGEEPAGQPGVRGEDGGQAGGEAEGLTLTAQTEETRQAEEAAAAEKERQEQERAAEEKRKAQADKDREGFTLSGSNRPADVAMAGGQADLLSQPKGEAAEPQSAEEADKDVAEVEGLLAEGRRSAHVIPVAGKVNAGNNAAATREYEAALERAGWKRSGDKWSKGDWSLFLRSQGSSAQPIVQYKAEGEKAGPQGGSKPSKVETAASGAENTVFTQDAAEAARALLKKKGGQIRTGLDPEMMQAGITLAGYHIERGARTFAAYAKAMLEDLGEAFKPYLKSWYMGVKYDPRAAGFDGMSSAAEVDSYDLDAETPKEPAEPPKEEAQQPGVVKVIQGPDNMEARIALRKDGKFFVTLRDQDANEDLGIGHIVDTIEKAEAKAREILNLKKGEEPGGMSDVAVLNAFFDRLAGGGRFATIRDARAEYERLTGKKAEGANQKRVDELLEAAVVRLAREKVQARGKKDPAGVYGELIDLYGRQPNLGTRTSTSVENQAYSTPAPLAWIASRLAGIDNQTSVLEPTAGTGMLLIGANREKTTANELDPQRVELLQANGFRASSKDAATEQLRHPGYPVDVVIANPPFGAVRQDGESKLFTQTWPNGVEHKTTNIDHAIAINALQSMAKDGRAVLIVGGPAKTAKTREARSDAYSASAKRKFYFHLYSNYNVVDHFTVAGELYEKQGAGWPVDVIVIEGRGKSKRALPAVDVPRVYADWEGMRPLLEKVYDDGRVESEQRPDADEDRGGAGEQGAEDGPGNLPVPAGRPDTGDGGQVGGSAGGNERPGDRTGGRRPVGTRPRPGEAGGRADSDVESVAVGEVEQPATDGRDQERPAAGDAGRPQGDRGGQGGAGAAPAVVGVRPDVVASEGQTKYTPTSKANALGTLVPSNMRTAVSDSLKALEDRVGPIDEFVAKELGYDPATLGDYFAAEQVDALGLALDQMKNGKGFIIGDQTGIGKGRVVAGVIRYALRNGMTPMFVTEKPGLYADMYRDLKNIGVTDIRPVMTNAGESVPFGEGLPTLKTPDAGKHNAALGKMVNAGSLDNGNMIFTTYNQMQSKGGSRTARMDFLEAFAPNSIVIMDESHNAGGTDEGRKSKRQREEDENTKAGRAAFARQIVGLSKGVFYSSATYAKRPSVMDLYFKTDMVKAVQGQASKLAAAIIRGGVPLQQVVAAMLTKAGQYIRRERTFDGVEYNTPSVPIDLKAAEGIASVMLAVKKFDDQKEAAVDALSDLVKGEAGEVLGDSSVGDVGAKSTNFTSVMHNMVDQMLLALKADEAADRAIQALKNGEKPVLTVANTMGSFIDQFVTENNIVAGDAINLSFRDLLMRYLERSRDVTIKDVAGNKTKRRLTDEELGPGGVKAYNDAKALIKSIEGVDNVPISPIDWIHNKIRKAGYSSAEITGRNDTIDYSEGTPVYRPRPTKESSTAGRRKTIDGFNNDTVNAVILNQAGSTGLSLHASVEFKNKSRRRMIIVQAEKNIDTHMQMLGRVHRTGQIMPPVYDQLVADIPAEKRPAAVLAKKMASLNANTTASRDSQFTSKEIVDFMNEYGDEVAAQLMADMPEVHEKLGEPLKMDKDGFEKDDAARKVTGRVPMLPVDEQRKLYDLIEQGYKETLARAEAMGENALEARTLDLDARTKKSFSLFDGDGSGSPFGEGANMEIVDVKRLGKPMTSAQVLDRLRQQLDAPADAAIGRLVQLGIAANRTRAQETEQAYKDYLKDMTADLAEADEQYRDSKLAIFQLQRDRWRAIASNLVEGRSYRITTGDNTVLYGVLADVKRKTSVKNPVAPGAWTATFLVADGMRQITLPFTKLAPMTEIEGKVSFYPSNETASGKPIMGAFDEGQTASREERVIVTGNLLAGFGSVDGGQIVNYTTDSGRVQQGILMPRSFDLKEFAGEQPVQLKAGQIVPFLQKALHATVTSPGALLAVTNDYGRYRISVPKSKAEGGRFFLDEGLRRIVGDFISSGNAMRVTVDGPTLTQAMEYLERKGSTFQTAAYKDEAKAVGGTSLADDINRKQPQASGRNPDVRVDIPPGGTGLKARDIRIAARKAFGPNVDRLIQRGILNLANSVSDLPKHLQDWVEGFRKKNGSYPIALHDRDSGTVWLIADRMRSEEVEGIILHEVGAHYGLPRILGAKTYADLLEQVRSLNGRGAKLVTDAWEEVTKSYPALEPGGEQFMEEVIAHIAEDPRAFQQTWWQRVLSAVRRFLLKMGFTKQLTDQDLGRVVLGALKGVMRGNGIGASMGGTQAKTVYHGTPHTVDRFSLHKIGSGEGAQAFGWGLYFASKKEVAEFYRDTLSPGMDAELTESDFATVMQDPEFPEGFPAQSGLRDNVESSLRAPTWGEVADYIDGWGGDGRAYVKSLSERYYLDTEIAEGNLYQVDIPDEHDLLDWDKTLDKQSPEIQTALLQIQKELPQDFHDEIVERLNADFMELTGEELYRALGRWASEAGLPGIEDYGGDLPRQASEYLKSHGIVGLQYAAGRFAGREDGGTNYVIWDDSLISEPEVLAAARKAQTETPEFKRWFGDSQVVDQDGRPLVLYHATVSDFSEFRVGGKAEFRVGGHSGPGIWASPSRTELRSPHIGGYQGQFKEGANVMPIYMRLERPLKVTPETLSRHSAKYGQGFPKMLTPEAVEKLKFQGFDGVIDSTIPGEPIEYIALAPGQIKSAIGNRGTFDPNNQSILAAARRAPPGSPANPQQPLPLNTQQIGIPEETRLDQLQRVFQDKFNRVGIAQEALRKAGRTIADAADVYEKEQQFYGKTESRLEYLDREYTQKILEAMASLPGKAKEKLKLVDQFLYAKHAPERNAYIASINSQFPDGGSGMLTADATNWLNGTGYTDANGNFVPGVDQSLVPQMESIASMVYRMQDNKLNLIRVMGLATPQEIAAWKGSYKFYVPLKSDLNPNAKGTGMGYDIRGKETKWAFGRRSMASSPLLNSIRDYQRTIIRAGKAEVGRAALALARAHPDLLNSNGDPLFEVREPKDFQKRQIVTHKIHNPITGQTTITRDVEYVYDPSYGLNKNVFAVKEGGKQVWLVIDDAVLAEQLKNMGDAQLPAGMRWLGLTTRFMSALNTAWNPEFWITNFARDLQTALIHLADLKDRGITANKIKRTVAADVFNLRSGVLPAIAGYDLAKKRGRTATSANAKITEWRQWMQDFEANGGKVGFYGMDNLTGMAKDVEKRLKALSGTAAAMHLSIDPIKNRVEALNSAFENALRLSTYRRLVEAGVSKQKAAVAAKNLTVNFNKKGQVSNILGAYWMFFNAAVQGTARATQAIFRSKTVRAVAVGYMMSGMLAAAWNHLVGGEDEEKKEPNSNKYSDWVKNTNFMLLAPDGEIAVKIPMAYGYNLPYVIGYRIVEAMMNPTKGVGDFIGNVAGAAASVFDPTGAGEGIGEVIKGNELAAVPSAVPSLMRPLTETWVNRNFMGNKISPEGFGPDDYTPDSERAWAKTPEFYKTLARAVNELGGGNEFEASRKFFGFMDISPESFQHIAQGYAGGLGRSITAATIDPISNLAAGKPAYEQGVMAGAPGIRRVVGTPYPGYRAERYYEIKRAIGGKEDAMKAERTPDEVREQILEKWGDVINTYDESDSAIRHLRKELRQTEDADERKQIEKEIEAYMDRAISTYNAIGEGD